MPDQGLRIPHILQPFLEPIFMALNFEENNYGFSIDHFVYVTVDQKQVKKGKTGRRAGAHSDAYIEKENAQIDVTLDHADFIKTIDEKVSHTYIAHSSTPTEFFAVPFPLENTTCQGSLKTFDEIANETTPITYDNFTLLKMTPYVVHRCAIVEEDHYRTFLKVSFSTKKYSRIGNTKNNLFDYNWDMSVRSPDQRNHPWK
jgi:hypothetical protein